MVLKKHKLTALLEGTGSAKPNGREPKCCVNQVFKFKLGLFVMYTIPWPIQAHLTPESRFENSAQVLSF